MREKARGRGPSPASGASAPRARARNARRAPPAKPSASAAPSPAAQESGELLYGLHAGLAVFQRRPDDIRSIGFDPEQKGVLRSLLRWAAARGVPVRELSLRELSAQADSNQHEGLLLECKARTFLTPKELASTLLASGGLCVALDRVRNPQNIGAILRSAAFFGANVVLLGAPAPHPGLPPFALRVAEGGAEHLSFSRTTDLADTLSRLRSAGVKVVGGDTHAAPGSEHLPSSGATLLVLGNEREGLSPRIRAQCDTLIGISGSGAVESLNVAVAAGVLLAELRRARQR